MLQQSCRPWTAAAVLLSLLHTTTASVLGVDFWSSINSTAFSHGEQARLHARAAVGGGNALRIMPLGDSITEGWLSSDGNGYRLDLRNLLVASGSTNIDFIGSNSNGNNNPDNQHEGFGGYTINQIFTSLKADHYIFQNPNVVLLHAGTNDIWRDPPADPYDGAPARLGSLIDYILCNDPTTVLLVALIITNAQAADRTSVYNSKLFDIVAPRYKAGYKVRLVDFSSITDSDLTDGVHPTDSGYNKMAQIWFKAMENLPSDWITAPLAPDSGSLSGHYAETCARDKLAWGPAINGDPIALGAHVPGDDGSQDGGTSSSLSFQPWWQSQGTIALGIQRDGNFVQYADIDGDGKADYLWIDPQSGAVSIWLNKGLANYQPFNGGNAAVPGVGAGTGVHFADMDGDKRADLLFVGNDGTITVQYNLGPSGNSWAFSGPATINLGYTNQFNVIFGDLNGDGRADILRIDNSGVIDSFVQSGSPIGTSGFQWLVCSNVATSVGNPNIRLADLNGDGRAEFLSLDDDGGIKGWLNVPDKTTCLGTTWQPIGGDKGVAYGEAPGSEIRLADVDGDGKADYLIVDPAQGATTLWLNTGIATGVVSGPTTNGLTGLGAAVRLADLDGDGLDDYISLGPVGQAIGFLNGGQYGDDSWRWIPINNYDLIAYGSPGGTRHMIHFADINGDGRADYLVVDDTTGAVRCYYNGGLIDGVGWIWQDQGTIAAGVGPGKGVRFADMNGDGRADYIYVSDNSAAAIYINLGYGDQFNGWLPVQGGKNVALGVGANGVDIQFADIDGDGLADYLWIHPEQGRIDVWWNGGPSPDLWYFWPGSSPAAYGVGYPGKDILLGRMTTQGRPDYLVVGESDGSLKCWFNLCFELVGFSGAGNFTQPQHAVDSSQCGSAPEPTQTAPDPGAPTGTLEVVGGSTTLVVGATGTQGSGGSGTGQGTGVGQGGGVTSTTTNGGAGQGGSISSPTPTSPIFTYQGGSTTINGGSVIVVSGSTITVGGSTTVSGGQRITPTTPSSSKPWPQCFGHCVGPDCSFGGCTGPLCVCVSCYGPGCQNNYCTSSDCTPVGCVGECCINGFCSCFDCTTNGCTGSDCGDDGKTHGSDGGGGGGDHHCHGFNCISVDCLGLECSGHNGGQGLCNGPACSIGTCIGPDCYNGGCIGPQCVDTGTVVGGSDAPPQNPNQDCEEGTQTVTNCYGLVVQGTSTTSTTSRCSVTTGCGITATTTTSTIAQSLKFAPATAFRYDPGNHPPLSAVNSEVASSIASPLQATPISSSNSDWAMNTYSDSNCQDFAVSVSFDDVGLFCGSLPYGINSYSFVKESYGCGGSGQYDNAVFYTGYQCNDGGIVAEACGQQSGCQSLSSTVYSIVGGTTSKRRSVKRDFAIYQPGNWSMPARSFKP